MTRKKKLLIWVALLAVSLVAAVMILQNPLGKLAKLAIEEFGPTLTQSKVTVGKVKISAADGHGRITNLFVGNPKGFKTDYALKAGLIDVVIEPASITEDVLVIPSIVIDAPQITYEKNGDLSNFDAIQRNVEKAVGAGKSDSEQRSKKMIIGSFVIRNAQVSYHGMLDLTLPDIELHNIGKKNGGATSAQVVKAIVTELNNKLMLAVAKVAIIGGVGGVAVGAGALIKGLLGN
jgi:hypothetical protein